jgi:hypothetical protein
MSLFSEIAIVPVLLDNNTWMPQNGVFGEILGTNFHFLLSLWRIYTLSRGSAESAGIAEEMASSSRS